MVYTISAQYGTTDMDSDTFGDEASLRTFHTAMDRCLFVKTTCHIARRKKKAGGSPFP